MQERNFTADVFARLMCCHCMCGMWVVDVLTAHPTAAVRQGSCHTVVVDAWVVLHRARGDLQSGYFAGRAPKKVERCRDVCKITGTIRQR